MRSQVGTSLNGSISQLAPLVISRDLPDPNPLASYALELVSEFLTREKREYMLKGKWAKSGRDQLSKDLGEVEAGLCITGRNNTSTHAPILLPIFLLLRRTYALPPSPLPSSMIDPYLDILPVPPDPDDVPFREPTVQSTTATLYVNPRLDDAAALGVIEELVENEREQIGITGGTREEATKWITGLIESVEKRVNYLFWGVRVYDADRISFRTDPTPASSLSSRTGLQTIQSLVKLLTYGPVPQIPLRERPRGIEGYI